MDFAAQKLGSLRNQLHQLSESTPISQHLNHYLLENECSRPAIDDDQQFVVKIQRTTGLDISNERFPRPERTTESVRQTLRRQPEGALTNRSTVPKTLSLTEEELALLRKYNVDIPPNCPSSANGDDARPHALPPPSTPHSQGLASRFLSPSFSPIAAPDHSPEPRSGGDTAPSHAAAADGDAVRVHVRCPSPHSRSPRRAAPATHRRSSAATPDALSSVGGGETASPARPRPVPADGAGGVAALREREARTGRVRQEADPPGRQAGRESGGGPATQAGGPATQAGGPATQAAGAAAAATPGEGGGSALPSRPARPGTAW
jgi:hypothetical protein